MTLSTKSVADIMTTLHTALDSNDAIGTVAKIDHQANAARVDEKLRATQLTLFGNPLLGTPLMQINQQAGLDLPQRLLAFEDSSGQSHIHYRSADYLRARHGLEDATETLEKINNALGKLASTAAEQEASSTAETLPAFSEGIVTVDSDNDMQTTCDNLRTAIESINPIKLVAELDHSANAHRVGEQLPPTKLFIFGNPQLGTPLMQSSQSVAIDLPQKMLVFENDAGKVSVAYDDPTYTARLHSITDQAAVIDKMTVALDKLAAVATST